MLPCDLSSKPLPRPNGHWKTSDVFWILPFLLGKSCRKINPFKVTKYCWLLDMMIKDQTLRLCEDCPVPSLVCYMTFLQVLLQPMLAKQTTSTSKNVIKTKHVKTTFPKLIAFTVVPKICLAKNDTNPKAHNNPTVPSRSQTKVPQHQGLQVPCHAG